MPRLTPRRLLAALVVVSAVAVAASYGERAWRYNTELTRAEAEMVTRRDARDADRLGRLARARDRLARLASTWPGRDEIEYPLGVCEAGLGHVAEALDAWARVPSGSVMAPRAALDRARLAIEHGRLAVAEEALATLRESPGRDGDEAASLAMQLDLFSGRGYEINRRIERRSRSSPDLVKNLRTHWLYDTQPYPIDAIRDALERFTREAPDDDRVWLGQADLATRTGRFAEADAWLARCEARRPDDAAVRRARLAWALDAGRADSAEAVAAKIPAASFTRAEAAAIAARLADLRGEAETERSALARRVSLVPGDAEAWGRLAEVAPTPEVRAEARRRKAEIDRMSDDYKMRMGAVGQGDRDHPLELARDAEALGRRFEAQGWWSLRARQAADDPEARAALARLAVPDPAVAPASSAPGALAEIIAPPRPSPPTRPALATSRPVSAPAFRDEADSAGLRFVYDNDQSSLSRLPETMGGGLALIDFDGDGWLDVYTVQGGTFPPAPDDNSPNGDRLFRNNRDGTFSDVSESSGIASFRRGFGHGVAVGDVDNDGRPDLFVTRWRGYALYRNLGGGRFEDATERAGLAGPRGWPTSAAFGDLDGDGDLDLYVCQYLVWDPAQTPPCPDPDHPGRHLYCGPRAFEAEPDRVYRNDGGRFVDVTTEAGFVDREGRGLGVLIADLDGDGLVDVFVANDMTANYLFRNKGGFRFEEVGVSSGVASNSGGGYQAGMGVACGDVDGDGLLDLAVTNFFGESTSLFKNLGGGVFADRTVASGLAAPTRHVLGFGLAFLDADNDGRLDLAQANGHVNDYRPSIPYAMPAELFLGDAHGRLVLSPDRPGNPWASPRVGRGLAVGDVDNDGRADVLILSQRSPLAYLRNLGPADDSITLRLEGKGSNRDAVGAIVRATSGGRTQVVPRLGGGSFLSASDGRVRFGLGPREGTERPAVSVEVRWPGGRVDRHEGLRGVAYQLVEGDPVARPLAGWNAPR